MRCAGNGGASTFAIARHITQRAAQRGAYESDASGWRNDDETAKFTVASKPPHSACQTGGSQEFGSNQVHWSIGSRKSPVQVPHAGNKCACRLLIFS